MIAAFLNRYVPPSLLDIDTRICFNFLSHYGGAQARSGLHCPLSAARPAIGGCGLARGRLDQPLPYTAL